jgi:hypothetical protein
MLVTLRMGAISFRSCSRLTVEEVCWGRHDCVLMKSRPVKFRDDQHVLILIPTFIFF